MDVAGTGGAAADAGPPVTPHPSGCSCATAPQGESPWSLALGLLAALALAARVRRAAPARVRRPGRR
jgi:MYXO-CTERM domain-containing protein